MTASLTGLAHDLAAGDVKVVDLTQPLSPATPVIELPPPLAPSPSFKIETISKYDEHGPAWFWSSISCGEHTGTHFDAPVHWITGRDLANSACDTIEPARFIGPACVIDFTQEAASDADALLTPEHILAWEREHGRIKAGSWALLWTDWSKRRDPAAYVNKDENGPHSPGFTLEASQLLALERDVLGVGVETIGTDAGQAGAFDPPFPNHHTMHGAGKLGLASLCHLDQLPPTGAIVVAAPLKIVGGSGSPVRALAIVPA